MVFFSLLWSNSKTRNNDSSNAAADAVCNSSCSSIVKKEERLRASEAALLQFTGIPASSLRTIDTAIPANNNNNNGNGNNNRTAKDDDVADGKTWKIHSIEVTSSVTSQNKSNKETAPLVLLHGYMNGGAYFYRNFAGLRHYFDTVHAIDWLGWGLSSRPHKNCLVGKAANGSDDDPIASTESFFVESLEQWRKQRQIPKMILAGHSLGGYLSVAYAEQYPERVERLILISPVGVPIEPGTVNDKAQQQQQTRSWRVRILYGLYKYLFPWYTAGDLLRSLPESMGRDRILQYVARRLPSITHSIERQAIANYLYDNNTLTGSGEYCVPHLLYPSIYAKRPLLHRIPKLAKTIPCMFLYGEHDWMDVSGGLQVQQQATNTNNNNNNVGVWQVRNAGHLLMVENPNEFNAGVALAAGRTLLPNDGSSVPLRL